MPLRSEHAQVLQLSASRSIVLKGKISEGVTGHTHMYDAVVIPGGGLKDDGEPHGFVAARLDEALQIEPRPRWFVVLSRGTTHRAPPLDAQGRPVDESSASAQYLIERGVEPNSILKDTWSLDTIGNAYFCRCMIVDPLEMSSLVVVTSSFHLARTRSIFDWVFGMENGDTQVKIEYRDSSDANCMAEDILQSRQIKEANALVQLESTKSRIKKLSELARFLFIEHAAYNAAAQLSQQSAEKADPQLLRTY